LQPSEAGVLIRRADAQDASEVAGVLRQSFLEYQDQYTPEGFAATTPGEQQVRSRMAEGPAWVALLSNADVSNVIGTASVVEKDDAVLYVRGMAVLPSARGRGVGELLLREIEAFAMRNSCTRLLLSTTPFLAGAIRLYERFGFKRTPGGPNDLFGTPLFTMAKALNGKEDFEQVTRKENLCRRTTDTPPAFA
jgi:ribosomal protein S18 acetylase RimI-like enzyme